MDILLTKKGYCPSTANDPTTRHHTERAGIFDRVQLPQEQTNTQPLLRGHTNFVSHSQSSYAMRSRYDDNHKRYNSRDGAKKYHKEIETYHSRSGDGAYHSLADEKANYHSDRVIRTRDRRPGNSRYSNSKYRTRPYVRKQELTWRERQRTEKPRKMENDNLTNALNSSGITQSGKLSTEGPREIGGHQESKENDDLVVERQEKRLARTIVTPSRTVALTANVTFRAKEIAQSLSLSPKTSYLNEDALVIGALSDMEIADKHDDEMMEGEVQNDDLLGIDLWR